MSLLSLTGGYTPNVAVLGKLHIWAENGSIHMADQGDGKHKVIVSLNTAKERIQALCDMLKKPEGRPDTADERALRRKIADFANKAMEIIAQAGSQGNFYDPAGRRDRVRRAPKKIAASYYDM